MKVFLNSGEKLNCIGINPDASNEADFTNTLRLIVIFSHLNNNSISRGGSRAAATSTMECFVIIVNGLKPLTIIPKHSILDVAAALDPPLIRNNFENLEEVVSSHVDILVIACRDKDR